MSSLVQCKPTWGPLKDPRFWHTANPLCYNTAGLGGGIATAAPRLLAAPANIDGAKNCTLTITNTIGAIDETWLSANAPADSPYVAPRNEAEAFVQRMFAQVLSIPIGERCDYQMQIDAGHKQSKAVSFTRHAGPLKA